MRTLGTALLTALKEHGAPAVFGIPGDFVLPLYKIIEESRILPHFEFSHEPAVGFAADGAARFQRALGVAVVTYGAGAFNIVNAVAAAYAEHSPLVVIAGAPGMLERSRGLLLHHQARTIDTQLAIFREITCDQAVLSDLEKAPDEIARVLRSARERSLPVYIEVPRDLATAPCGKVPVLLKRGANIEALAECADEICTRLRNAKRPIIMVDVEVRRYGLEARVAQLGRTFRVPVVTTFMGRGLMADAADITLGTYLGGASSTRVKHSVENADAALLLGVIVSDTNFALSAHMLDPRKAMRAIDRGVRVGHHEYTNIPLDALVDAILARAPRGKKGRKQWSVSEDKSLDRSFRYRLKRDDKAIAPSDVATAVNEMFAKHGAMPMTSDVGDCLFVAMEIEHSELAAPAYYAGMGFGVPAGMGIAAAAGARPLILVGDGAFQMTGFELGNCRRYGIDPIVLVFNNQSWEMLRAFQPESAFNNLDDWHFAAVAPHLGGHGERVRTRRELATALERAVARRGNFSLIEIMLRRGVTSNTLERFVRDFRESR